jgi:nitrile hydratase beta subunit
VNGAHDLGGMHGFGPVDPEPNEPLFQAEWERRTFALTLALGALGQWNIDMSRHAREQADPQDYLRQSYYEHWLHGLMRLLPETGLASAEEIASGQASALPKPVSPLRREQVWEVLARGASARRPETHPARFAVGDAVKPKIINPTGHTRLPRYARGRPGIIARVHGVFVLPDTNASGRGENPEWCYSVRFMARDLWGADANPRDSVHIDLWESYLEPR